MRILPVNSFGRTFSEKHSNYSFKSRYVSGFETEPLRPSQIVDLAKTIFKATSEEFARFKAGIVKVSNNELIAARASLIEEPIGFNPEQVDQIINSYTSESGEFLNLLLSKEVKGQKKFQNSETIVSLMKLYSKYPERVQAIVDSDSISEVMTVIRLMMDLPPAAPEKLEFFKDRNFEEAVQAMMTRKYLPLNRAQAEQRAYELYGLKPSKTS